MRLVLVGDRLILRGQSYEELAEADRGHDQPHIRRRHTVDHRRRFLPPVTGSVLRMGAACFDPQLDPGTDLGFKPANRPRAQRYRLGKFAASHLGVDRGSGLSCSLPYRRQPENCLGHIRSDIEQTWLTFAPYCRRVKGGIRVNSFLVSP